jgi:prepilin-type N-terminal cleavage/methylation domain-containing protein
MFTSASARREDGMTLMEVLVTLLLIGLLASISVPVMANITGATRTQVTATNAQERSKFVTQWTNEGYAVAQGTGNNNGYLIAFDDRNGNQILDGTEQLFGRLVN